MTQHLENPFTPPESDLHHGPRTRPRPLLCFLGIIVGLFAGLASIISLALILYIHSVFGILFFILFSLITVVAWRIRYKKIDRHADFNLGFLITISVFVVFTLLVLLLRQVPNARKTAAGLTNHSTRTLPLRASFPSGLLGFLVSHHRVALRTSGYLSR